MNFFEMKEYIYDHAEYMTESNPQLSMYYAIDLEKHKNKTVIPV